MAKRNGIWAVQTRIFEYLNELRRELGPIVFFARVAPENTVGVDFPAQLSEPGVRVVPMSLPNHLGIIGKAAQFAARSRRLDEELSRCSSVIHSFPTSGGLFSLSAISRRSRAHLVYMKNDWIAYTRLRGGFARLQVPYWWLAELLEVRAADAVLFRSQRHKNRLAKHSQGLVEVAQPMLATTADRFPEFRSTKSRIWSGVSNLLYVGGLYKKKGLEDLMVALGWMRSQGAPPFRLVLIGGQGGAMESVVPDWLSKTIADQHLTNVVSARGFVNDRAELAKHYSQADVFILPSWSEGFPRVVDEAMSFGVPVVATTVGGIPEVLEDGRDALLVKPRRPIDLGKTLLDLLSSNDETRRKLGAAGRRSYESRVRETAAKQQARLIREVWARKCNSLV